MRPQHILLPALQYTPLRPSSSSTSSIPTPAHSAAKPRPSLSLSPAPSHAPTRVPGPLALPPHRGSCQNEDGFLSRERHIRVRLNQGLHSRERQPRETGPGRTRRSLRLRGRCLPTGPLLFAGRPAPRSGRRHPARSVLRAAPACARAGSASPFPARAGGHALCGRGPSPRAAPPLAQPRAPGNPGDSEVGAVCGGFT